VPRTRRRQRARRGGANEMGKRLLKLFEPGMDAVMTRMGPSLTSRDIISIVKCHPELWRHRKTLLPALFGHAVPEKFFEYNAPPIYAAPLCRRLEPKTKTAAALMFLRMAAERGDLEGVKEIIRAFQITRSQLEMNHFKAFETACYIGHPNVAKWLANELKLTKADIVDGNCMPITGAAEAGHLGIAKWLTDHFKLSTADIRANDNLTLRLALEYEQIDMADWLVDRFGLTEADVRDDNNVAIREACERSRHATLDWMKEKFKIDECDEY